MNRYYILLSDEWGESFGFYMYADSIEDCLYKLDSEYPESCGVNIDSRPLQPISP